MKFTLINTAALAGAIATWIGGDVLLTFASGETGFTKLVFFIAALVAGIINPAFLTVVLKDNNPNIVYATFGGIGSVLLYWTLGVIFGKPFTFWHWIAIAVVIAGTILLQVKPEEMASESQKLSTPGED